ncbi:MAG: amino acid adenylation domain-containing protein, partial [Gammaproteobacteria bacterium]
LQAPASNSGLQRLLEKEAMRPFELGEGPLVRFLLFRQSAGHHVLLLVGHHLVMDGWSIGLLIRELSELYTAAAQNRPHRLAPPPASYAELMRSEAEWLRSGAAARQLEYWRSRLAGELPVLDMPTDRPRPPARSNQGASTSLLLDPDLCRRLDALARREQGTRLMVIAAAVSALLGRMADQPEVILGMPLANRTTPARAALAGLFMNTVALRLPVDPERDFTSLVRTCRHAVLDALDNQRIPFDRVVEALRPPRDPSRTVVYQALLAFQPEPETGMRMGKLTLTPVAVARCTAQTDLAFWCAERDDGLDITLEYSTDLYTEATARELLNRLQRLLVAVAGDASRPVGAVQLASDADGRRLAEWGTGPAIPLENTSLDRLIVAQCADTPRAVAVSQGEQTLRYAELEAASAALAARLQAAGAAPGRRVGVLMDRRVALPAVLLGIWRAGAAYLPLDPGLPPNRLQLMLADAGAELVVAEPAHRALLGDFPGQVLDPDGAGPAEAPTVENRSPEDPAYVIYTSGSTGKPKGVAVPHRALVNFLRGMQHLLEPQADERMLALTTLSFDIAGLELYLPLLCGARTEIVEREVAGDGHALVERLAACRPTMMQATPATWQLLLEAGWTGDEQLTALCGGEALPAALAGRLLPITRRLWNLYGPTETTIWSTACRVTAEDDPVPIGRPIANTRVYVLDRHRQPVPPGVAGELWIGGDGVALGYLGRPELTAERFLADPFSPQPGARMYRTGDRVRFRGDGALEYFGRLDFQLKLRGHRIEPGEIEAVLLRQSGVDRAVVGTVGEGTDVRLAAWLVLAPGTRLSVAELRERLRHELPDYMLPQHFMEVAQLPLTPSGKVDRKALPSPLGAPDTGQHHVAPRTPTEQCLASIWQDILGIQRVGLHDNFFDLGGHSLSSMRAISRIESETGVRLRPRVLVLHTLAEIAADCAAGAAAPHGAPEHLPRRGWWGRLRGRGKRGAQAGSAAP